MPFSKLFGNFLAKSKSASPATALFEPSEKSFANKKFQGRGKIKEVYSGRV